jgi:hypothetical protein
MYGREIEAQYKATHRWEHRYINLKNITQPSGASLI